MADESPTPRRKFLSVLGTSMFIDLDSDGDGDYLDDIFGWDTSSEEAGDTLTVLESGETVSDDVSALNSVNGLTAAKAQDRTVDLSASTQSDTGTSSSDTDNYPHYPRVEERDGPPSYKPYPGASNPVLTKGAVTDVGSVQGIADPFVGIHNSHFYLFFEVIHSDESLAYASSPDGLSWTYGSVIDAFHGSGEHWAYPYYFRHSGTHYILPDRGSGDVTLYSATSFPSSWSKETDIKTGGSYRDPTLFRFDETWYLVTYDNSVSPSKKRLYYADSMAGSYTEHPSSPIASGTTARNAGRPIVYDDYVDFFSQDRTNSSVVKVICHRITDLSPETFSWSEVATSPVLSARQNGGWNDTQMHHIDPMMSYIGGDDIVIVDGMAPTTNEYSIGAYTTGGNGLASARAYLGTNDTGFSSGSWYTVGLDSISDDANELIDTTTGRITIPSDGWYRINPGVEYKGGSGGTAPFQFSARVNEHNSGATISYDSLSPGGSVNLVAGKPVEWKLKQGDELKLQAYQDSGSAATILGLEFGTYLEVTRINKG